MARMYFFAIGGTGARVLRALTHLLAAGTMLRDYIGQPMELVPLIVDPDAENGDTLDCLNTLAAYTDLRNKYLSEDYVGSFFATRITRFQELRTTVQEHAREPRTAVERDSFRCGIVDHTRHQQFSDVIGYNYLTKQTRLLLDSLYSQENLDTRLSGGFLGNPNIGTVVLSQLKASEQFRMLPGLFHPEDRIFIASSIFGGTGSSGFPVLAKLIREATDEQGHQMTVLRDAAVGALTVLPYFSLASDVESPIDSNAFVPKTKAALAYYAEHLNEVQALYYLGDKTRRQYANTPTGPDQVNQDHLVELVGATSVVHFAEQPASPLQRQFHECALKHAEDRNTYDLRSLGDEFSAVVGEPLTAFAMALEFLAEATSSDQLPRLLAQPWTREGEFTAEFFQSTSYSALTRYLDLWRESFDQLASNEPAFRPFRKGLANLRPDRPEVVLDRDELNKKLNLMVDSTPTQSIERFLQMLSFAARELVAIEYGSGVMRT